MGLRGALPTLRLRSNPLEDLTPPDWLGKLGRAYWVRHCDQLAANHLLTRETCESFAMLCDVWEQWRELQPNGWSKEYELAGKAYQALAKFFRLLPTEKPHVKEDRYADFSEVEL